MVLIQQSFSYDYENARISSLVPNGIRESELRSLILKYYPQVKDVYQYLSALSPLNSVFCISQSVFAEFAKNCNLIDDKSLRITDIDVIFFTVYTPPSKNNSEAAKAAGKCLIRSQFIEALIKIAIEKYGKTLFNLGICESFERLLMENVLPNFRNIEGTTWKTVRFLTEKNEIVIKKNWQILEHLFKQTMNRKPSGQAISNPPNLVFYRDFLNLIFDADLISKSFTEKDVNVAFRLSLGFHPEDLSGEHNRNMILNFNEFIEAIARVAEKCGIVPLGEKENDLKWTVKLRSILPLHVKLEALMSVLFKRVCGKEFMRTVKMPERSEYGDDINQVFLAQMRGSASNFTMEVGQKRGENKTFMKSYLQKAINVAILMNKVTRNLMKHDVRKNEVDTPYH